MKEQTSVKSFGILFFFVFLTIGFWPKISGEEIRLWSIIISLTFLILGLINSKILVPLNKYWIKLGELLGKIIAPIVMLVIYFVIVTPIALLLKIFKKDILKLKLDKKLNSYWIQKDKDLGPMKNQF
tara:strand:- start:4011 stop:4391 length:381 start_codon:yes stop_codon:yes gene_type:complete